MPKRCIQRIYKHGNAHAVTLPRYLLFELGWVCGEEVIIQLLEDGTLWLRPPTIDDYKPAKSLRPPTMQPQSVTP